ncbi:MAG: hypothetical protein GDA40_08660 [Rhodobacteraceae bacterium]|nr:hypothetical protein [Paracoccaceae bacterium]
MKTAIIPPTDKPENSDPQGDAQERDLLEQDQKLKNLHARAWEIENEKMKA